MHMDDKDRMLATPILHRMAETGIFNDAKEFEQVFHCKSTDRGVMGIFE